MAKKEKEVKQKSSYFKDMKAELKKVVWPTPKELVNNTIAVIVFVLVIGVIVFLLDFCFDNLNKYGITKLQESVQSAFQTTEDSENVTEGEGTTSEEENGTPNETSEHSENAETSEGDSATNTEIEGEMVEVENVENQESTENSNTEFNE